MMKQGDVENIWAKVDRLLDVGESSGALDILEEYVPSCADVEELARVAKKLAQLYATIKKKGAHERAGNYALLAGQCYVRLGRVAPAVAIFKWMKGLDDSEKQSEELAVWITETFSLKVAPKKKSDDLLPVPTPYQEFTAVIALENQTWESFRHFGNKQKGTHALFAELKPLEVHAFIQLAEIVGLEADEVLFKENDDAKSFYVVAEGEMELKSSTGLRKLFREGDFFGELALLGKMKRSATLFTRSGAVLLEFSEKKLNECFKKLPTVKAKVLEFYKKRLFMNVAARSSLFSSFDLDEVEDIYDRLISISVPANKSLMDVGSVADKFYFVVQGVVDVVHGSKKVARLGPGQFVGEMGLLRQTARSASVVTAEPCLLLECNVEIFENLLHSYPELQHAMLQISHERELELFVTEPAAVD